MQSRISLNLEFLTMIPNALLFQELANGRSMQGIKLEKTETDEQETSTDLTSDSLGIFGYVLHVIIYTWQRL